jgi:hypothetical protein
MHQNATRQSARQRSGHSQVDFGVSRIAQVAHYSGGWNLFSFQPVLPAQVSLERETSLINGVYSDDALFLRQLVIEGQWDAALDFVEPLRDSASHAAFDFRSFKYLVLKYKLYELLCIRQEPGPLHDNEFTVEVGSDKKFGMTSNILHNFRN